MTDLEATLRSALDERADQITAHDRLDEILVRAPADAAGSGTAVVHELAGVDESDEPPVGRRTASARLALVAACVLVVVGVTVYVGRRLGDTDVATNGIDTPTPSAAEGEPALLEPGPDVDVAVATRFAAPSSSAEAGAAIAPSGTIYAFALGPPSEPPDPGESDVGLVEEQTLAGRPAWGAVDASWPEHIDRELEVGCAALYVSTVGAPMWGAETSALAESLSASADTVVLDLPAGWTSLGAARSENAYLSVLSVTVDGEERPVTMGQSVGAPIGFYLGGADGSPSDISDGDGDLWSVTFRPASPYRAVVGEISGTAFRMTGDVPLPVLVDLADSLVAYPADEWLDLPTSGEPPDTFAGTIDPDAADRAPCELERLEIREP
ncbi:MAG: hypothetical protein S0880_12110 [Actinomycetota bacterium]|nr:hypothetical protein [Actinomycetota bacterium]